MTTLYVDGENQGDGVCIRQNRNPEKATFPIEPLANDAVACGYDGETASSRLCPAAPNSTLTFEFREYPDGSKPGRSIDESHRGPCAIYMKKVEDATADDNAAGAGWFKIFELDYDESADKWCTEKLIENNGFLSAVIPAGLAGGDYLVRTELLALHAAQDSPPDPQFYVGCAQVFLEAGEDGDVPEGVVIDSSTYSLDDAGLTFNLYAEPLELPYPTFGPEVYHAVSGVAGGEEAIQSKGLEPDGCILVRDDWCGFEVSSYSDETGCWASSKECWDQADVCWQTAPPTGNKRCQIWSDKCTNIDDNCGSGNFNGPPNKGEVLTPALPEVGGATDLFTGGISSSDYAPGSGSESGSGSDEDDDKGEESGSGSGSASSVAPSSTTSATSISTSTSTTTTTSAESVPTETETESYATTTDAPAETTTPTPVEEDDEQTESGRPGRPGHGHGHGHGNGGGRCKARRSHKA
ncbi:glycosyl hydrolase family 61-domain-containing protein [Aspergillus crustosus]